MQNFGLKFRSKTENFSTHNLSVGIPSEICATSCLAYFLAHESSTLLQTEGQSETANLPNATFPIVFTIFHLEVVPLYASDEE